MEDSWASIYSKYVSRPVFAKGNGAQSHLFRKYFVNNNVDHVGWTTRVAKMDNKVTENIAFRDFMDEYHIPYPQSHRWVVKNIHAGFRSCAKYDRPQPTYDKKAWALACTWARTHFGPYVRGSKIIEQEEAIGELEKTSSAGFPWNLQFHTKAEMLATECKSVIDWYWNELVATETSYHPIWTCTQKVEMRPIEKLQANSIRTFTASPIEHTVALTRLCLHFNNLFYDADRTWSFVGRTKFARGWHHLIERLRRFPLGWDFDASSWDSSVFEQALLDQMEFRWESLESQYKTPETRTRLERLYQEIIHSYIVLENGELVQKHTGNPSGSANTIVDNTMVLYRVLAYCWIRACPEELCNYPSYHENVEGSLNGDDNTLTRSEDVASFFNAENIIKFSAELGVVMSTPNEKPLPAEQLSFLSQTTVRMFGFWLPCPDTEKILCSLWWGSEVDDVRWHLLRAGALYVESWPNLTCRKIIHDYISYLMRRFGDRMYGTINGIPCEHILMGIKDDRWCLQLYTGMETAYTDNLFAQRMSFDVQTKFRLSF